MQQSEFRGKDSVQKINHPNESQFPWEKHGKVYFSAFICALSRKTTGYKKLAQFDLVHNTSPDFKQG